MSATPFRSTQPYNPLSFVLLVFLVCLTWNADAATVYDQTINSGPNIGVTFGRPSTVDFTFTGTPMAIAGDVIGTLTVTAFGDLNNPVTEMLEVFAESLGGTQLDSLFGIPCADPCELTDSITIANADLAGFTADGSVTFVFNVPATSGISQIEYRSLNLTMTGSVIPLPAALPLFLSALAVFGFVARRRRHG